mmetsp:Transcript_39262/g.73245  ORF Transcript_39262/g.73245 Transcript_39262/m.73245 type:complete len:267 (+) Transcript_39262:127-927(+)
MVYVLQAAGLSFLAEIGDVSFFVTVILAAWCPLRGVRSGKGIHFEHALVTFGSLAALCLRVCLRSVGLYVTAAAGEVLPAILGAVACAALGATAIGHWSSARGMPELPELPEGEAPSAPVTGYGGSFLGNFQAYNPGAYGSIPNLEEPIAGRPETSGLKQEGVSSKTLFAAFFMPFFLNFLLESGSQGIELQVVRLSPTGCIGGTAAATLIATFFGFALERRVGDRTLLCSVAVAFLALMSNCLQMAGLRVLAEAYAPKLSPSLHS